MTIWLCVVVGVSDGDSLTARCISAESEKRRTVAVRLAEVDAPEHGQAFNSRSKRHLASLCFKAKAELRVLDVDRYGRAVARVNCNGTDANAAQVRAGMAWVFDQFATDRSLYELEAEARRARVGLWADPQPVPPWIWRRGSRPRRGAAVER